MREPQAVDIRCTAYEQLREAFRVLFDAWTNPDAMAIIDVIAAMRDEELPERARRALSVLSSRVADRARIRSPLTGLRVYAADHEAWMAVREFGPFTIEIGLYEKEEDAAQGGPVMFMTDAGDALWGVLDADQVLTTQHILRAHGLADCEVRSKPWRPRASVRIANRFRKWL